MVGFEFEIIEEGKQVTVFTTRPDTLYGVTALVLAPENTTLDAYIADEKKSIVEEYRKETMGKTAVQRQQDTKEKTGVFSGVYAIHPLTGETVPVRFADYVLPDYATGSVMLVPAHDERDREFAKKYALDIHHVIAKHYISGNKPVEGKEMQKRNNVLALVKHWSENKYACLDRSKPIFKSMIM